MTFDYYKTPHPVAYRDEILAPVPGWGMTPNLAGPRIIGIGETDGQASWWSKQSTLVKSAVMLGGVVAIGALGVLVWETALRSMVKGKKYESNDSFEENLSFDDVKTHAKKAAHKAKMGYEAAKPHFKKAYEKTKPHVKRIAHGAKKSAKKGAAFAAKKSSLLLARAAEKLEKKGDE